jgi:hypothetical protein
MGRRDGSRFLLSGLGLDLHSVFLRTGDGVCGCGVGSLTYLACFLLARRRLFLHTEQAKAYEPSSEPTIGYEVTIAFLVGA